MGRQERRKAEKLQKRRQTETRQRLEKVADRVIKKAIVDETKAIKQAFGLGEDGKGVQEYHTSVDTKGAISCLYMGDLDGEHIKYSAIAACAATTELKEPFLDQLKSGYGHLGMPLMGENGNNKVYFGRNVKVVLSRMRGELWSVYLGAENLIDRFIQTGSLGFLVSEAGRTAFWNEWEIRIREDTLFQWKELIPTLNGIIFHVLEGPNISDYKFIEGFDILIPEENIIIQEVEEERIPYGSKIPRTSNRWQPPSL